MKIKGIYWDDGNISHCQKHGVSIAEIEYVLHRVEFRIPDPFPNEPRYRTAGETAEGRYVFIVYMEYTKDDEMYLRPISTRYMHRKEIKKYEQFKKTMDKSTN